MFHFTIALYGLTHLFILAHFLYTTFRVRNLSAFCPPCYPPLARAKRARATSLTLLYILAVTDMLILLNGGEIPVALD